MSKTKETKKNKKVMTVDLPKPEVPTSAETIIGALLSLEASTGWAILVKIIKENIAYLEELILNKVDPINQLEITDEEVEILRIKRNLNIELLNTPENYRKKLIEEEEDASVEFDPYFKTSEEIKKSER